MGPTCLQWTWPPLRTVCRLMGGGAWSALLHHRRNGGGRGRNMSRIGAVVERRSVGRKFLGSIDELGVILDEASAQLARAEIRALEDGPVIADRRRRPDYHELTEGATRPCDGLSAIAAVDYELGHQRVVVGGHLGAGPKARIDTHPRSCGCHPSCYPFRIGHELPQRILCVDAHLDCVSCPADALLSKAQLHTGCNADLLLHQVDAGDCLCDGMLDLESRVDFEEIEVAFAEYELDSPRVDVAGGPGRAYRRLAHR